MPGRRRVGGLRVEVPNKRTKRGLDVRVWGRGFLAAFTDGELTRVDRTVSSVADRRWGRRFLAALTDRYPVAQPGWKADEYTPTLNQATNTDVTVLGDKATIDQTEPRSLSEVLEAVATSLTAEPPGQRIKARKFYPYVVVLDYLNQGELLTLLRRLRQIAPANWLVESAANLREVADGLDSLIPETDLSGAAADAVRRAVRLARKISGDLDRASILVGSASQRVDLRDSEVFLRQVHSALRAIRKTASNDALDVAFAAILARLVEVAGLRPMWSDISIRLDRGLTDGIDSVDEAMSNFVDVDLRDADLDGVPLEGVIWSTGTQWPAAWRSGVEARSLETLESDRFWIPDKRGWSRLERLLRRQ